MNATVNRAELLNAAACAAAVAPAASPIKEMTAMLLEADTGGTLAVTATNVETALEQKLPCRAADEDAVAVNARLFTAMLTKLPGNEAELFREPGSPQLHVRSGDAEYITAIWERGSFPKPSIPFPEDTVKVSGIPSMARRTVFAAAKESDRNVSRPLLLCVHLMFTREGLRAAGSDGACVVAAKGDEKSTGDISFLVPASSLEKLARMCGDRNEFHVGTTGKTVVFLRENFIYSARLMDGEYIDLERLTGNLQKQFTVLTDVPDLRKGLDSVVALDSDGKAALAFEGQRLSFRCVSAAGNASSTVEVIPLSGQPGGEFWYLSGQLSACLRALSGTVQLSIARGGMLLLETDDAFYMQTGVRATAVKTETEHKKPPQKAA